MKAANQLAPLDSRQIRSPQLALSRDTIGQVQHGSVTYETGRATDVDPSGVTTREDFVAFLSGVLADYRSGGAAEWENGTLDRLLEALAAYSESRLVDDPGYDQDRVSWRQVAEIVRAATGYK